MLSMQIDAFQIVNNFNVAVVFHFGAVLNGIEIL